MHSAHLQASFSLTQVGFTKQDLVCDHSNIQSDFHEVNILWVKGNLYYYYTHSSTSIVSKIHEVAHKYLQIKDLGIQKFSGPLSWPAKLLRQTASTKYAHDCQMRPCIHSCLLKGWTWITKLCLKTIFPQMLTIWEKFVHPHMEHASHAGGFHPFCSSG